MGLSVCLSVCLLSHISPMERLFVLKTLSRTQRATKVKKIVGFSLKPLRCRDPALPPLYGHAYNRPFSCGKHACALWYIPRALSRHKHCACAIYDACLSISRPGLAIEIQRRGFSTLVLFILNVVCFEAQTYSVHV